MRDYEKVAALSAKDKEVYKVKSRDGFYILKVYPDEKAAAKEVGIVQKVSMTGYAPKVVEFEGNSALYEYIEGENFNDAFKSATMTDDKQTMELLASRLSIFLQMIYSFTDCVMKEIDFGSYLIKDGRVIGVDFSNVDDGMPYEDLASAIVCALSNCVGEYYGCFPFVQKLLECFKAEMMDVINEIKLKLESAGSKAKESVDVELLIDTLANFDEKGVDWRRLI